MPNSLIAVTVSRLGLVLNDWAATFTAFCSLLVLWFPEGVWERRETVGGLRRRKTPTGAFLGRLVRADFQIAPTAVKVKMLNILEGCESEYLLLVR
jgi:hypothetical protein